MSVFSIVIQKKLNWITRFLLKSPLVSTILLWGGSTLIPVSVLAQQQYGVYVNGDSPLLLEVVQQVQPGAIVQKYRNRRIIDAGIYFNQTEAEQVLLNLRRNGITGQIIMFKPGENFSNTNPAIPIVIPPERTDVEILETSIPSGILPLTTDLGLFQVYVSPSTISLSEVRRLYPNAKTLTYNGQLVIQVASFVNRSNALEAQQQLLLQGISASVINSTADLQAFLASIPSIPSIPNFPPSFPPNNNLGLSSVPDYFVIIPSQSNQLFPIADNIIRLGIPSQSVIIRNAAAPPFVAVGPFANQTLALQWENYLRTSGLSSAIVYFGQ